MAIPAVGQKYLITIKGVIGNQVTMSTFWYQLENLGPAASVNAVYDVIQAQLAIANLLAFDFRACCPDNWDHTETWIQCVHPDRVMKRVVPINLPGAFPLSAMHTNLAAVIERRAEIADRKSVSTLHVPLPEPSDVGVIGVITDPVYLGKLNDLATEMKQDITSGGGAPTILRPVVFNPKGLPAPVSNRFIVQTTVMQTMRVMRRRTVGLGI